MVELSQAQNTSNQSLYMSSGGLGNYSHSTSIHDLNYKLRTQAGGSERLKFVGKHSKDKVLAVYLQKRTVYELEKEHKMENLLGVVRVSQHNADRIVEKGQGTASISL